MLEKKPTLPRNNLQTKWELKKVTSHDLRMASAIFSFQRFTEFLKTGLGSESVYLLDNLRKTNTSKLSSKYQLKYFPTIGTLLPTPNAFGEIRIMGQNWLRLYSLMFTSFKTLSTRAGSKSCAFIWSGPCVLSMY